MNWRFLILAAFFVAPLAASQPAPESTVWGFVHGDYSSQATVSIQWPAGSDDVPIEDHGIYQWAAPTAIARGTTLTVSVTDGDYRGSNQLIFDDRAGSQRVDIYPATNGEPGATSSSPNQVWGFVLEPDGETTVSGATITASWGGHSLAVTSEDDGYFQVDLGGPDRSWAPGQTMQLAGTGPYWEGSQSVALSNAGAQRVDLVLNTIIDGDRDGILDSEDNCPDASNPPQDDVDGDGMGNACDDNPNDGPLGDLDGDGVRNGDDNCPEASNAGQADLDGDGIGDECDLDVDGDHVPNDVEARRGTDSRDNSSRPSPPGFAAPSVKLEDSGANLTWQPIDGASSYVVWRSASPFAILASVAGDTQFLDTTVEPGKTYNYRVVGVDADGVGAAPDARFLSGFTSAPATPVSTPVPATGGGGAPDDDMQPDTPPDAPAPSSPPSEPVQSAPACPEPCEQPRLPERQVDTPATGILFGIAALAFVAWVRRR